MKVLNYGRVGNIVRSLRCWFYSLLFLISFPAYSAVTYETVRVAPGVYAPSGATQHDVTVATRRPDGVTRYHNIRPTMPPGTLGRLGRAAVRGGPASIAVTGIIEGLGYLIDQATGEIKKTEIIYGEPSGSYISVNLNAGTANTGACMSEGNLQNYASVPGQYRIIEVIGTCSGDRIRGYAAVWDCPANYPVGIERRPYQARCFVSSVDVPITENIIDLDPSDYHVIDSALANQLTLQQKTDLARRILTMTNSEIATIWPELSALAEAVRAAEQSVWDATLDPTVTPTPEQEAIVGDGAYELPQVYPDSPGEGGDGFWPAFCEWASFICAPFVESEHPPLPTVEIDIDDYDSGLPGDASCPAPYTFETDFTGPIEISYQPACDLAGAIRIPLLAISYLMAGFIVVGVRR